MKIFKFKTIAYIEAKTKEEAEETFSDSKKLAYAVDGYSPSFKEELEITEVTKEKQKKETL